MKPASSSNTLFTAPVILTLGLLAFAAMALLAFVWSSASPVLGRVYAAIRIAETGGLWLFSGWGQYFTSVPKGEPFSFISIFKSSVPFGVVAGMLIATLGALAYQKRKTSHLDVLMAPPPGGHTPESLIAEMMPVMPHLLPPAPPREGDGVIERAPPLSPNPFSALRDLRDGRSVQEAMASLSWPEAAAIALLTDALAPVSDRSRQEALDKEVWKAARAGTPPARDDGLAHTALTQAACDLRERDMEALEQAHEALAAPGSTHDAIAALAQLAYSRRKLRLPKFAWLDRLDPHVHARVYTAS